MLIYKFSDVCCRRSDRLPALRPDGKTYYQTTNIDKTFSILIANRLATLRELEEYYSLDDALDIVEKAEEGPIVLADASDNPGAGGMGETTHILRRVLERGITGCAVAAITDPESVAACEKAGLRAELAASGGGSDANNFNVNGVKSLVLGTGMDKVHTTQEQLTVKNLEDTASLVLSLIVG